MFVTLLDLGFASKPCNLDPIWDDQMAAHEQGAPDEEDVDDETYIAKVAMARKHRMDKRAEQIIGRHHKHHEEFMHAVRSIWGPTLDTYLKTVLYAENFGFEFIPILDQQIGQDEPHLVNVLARLHGSACLVAFEIWHLLLSGFAQGALARWRTLHEIATMALFLTEHREPLAIRYWRHGDIEIHKMVKENQSIANAYPESSISPYDDQYIEQVDEVRCNLLDRWGKSFGAQYGWAAEALNGQQPNFRNIEQAVDVLPIDTRWMYQVASLYIHPQISGITINFGLPVREQQLPIGERKILTRPSVFGLDTPANNALISLQQCVVALGTMYLAPEWEIRLKVFSLLMEEAQALISVASADVHEREIAAKEE